MQLICTTGQRLSTNYTSNCSINYYYSSKNQYANMSEKHLKTQL